jgi:hypothetical protein
MKAVLPLVLVLVAAPAVAQIRAYSSDRILRNAPPGTEEETPAAQAPVNLRPTQLLRCPDGKGGTILQDTPCKAAATTTGPAAAPAPEVTDLSQLAPRPQAEAPPPRVDDSASNRWTQGMLWGAGKLAALLAAIYALYRLGLWVRDKLQERMPRPQMESQGPRRIR